MSHPADDDHHGDAAAAPRRPLSATQRRVFEVLREAAKPLSAYEVLDRLRGEGISAPPTVYRALERLMGEGLAHRLESINAFVACAHPHPHEVAAFAICESCGAVSEFTDPGIEARLEGWAARAGFSTSRIAIELRGRCAVCRQAA